MKIFILNNELQFMTMIRLVYYIITHTHTHIYPSSTHTHIYTQTHHRTHLHTHTSHPKHTHSTSTHAQNISAQHIDIPTHIHMMSLVEQELFTRLEY